ncbi:GNAT family N-acetyltransferase [Roseicyclus mahoneyensis]|uniref:RimJ/RimL family protein N-acetyltransferase n=1 Tax=Roseicyclus mahoneyensis TaxID=164332 RepID=A0A316GIP2_9RHOB|nr:GNAT family N-acetyltransferase [Roseicyclus mahoneyensis]PWK60650.1 RimJ/RimL family protein N-acetyltransferase [Roseicyclus mahoneyensis]
MGMPVTQQQAPKPDSRQIAFRVIHATDTDFLFRVYASTREWEFRLTLWSEAEKQAFLRRQFDLQDRHYQVTFPDAIRRIITQGAVDIGRLYVQRQDACLRIIDFSLLPEARGRGIGTDILRSLMNEAHGGKVPVRLNVERASPALRLYLRHGFTPTGQTGHHVALEWRPATGPREI